MTSPTPLSVTVAHAAELTSLSQFEIRTAVSKGELAYFKRGRRIAIWHTTAPDGAQGLPLLDWMAHHTVTAEG